MPNNFTLTTSKILGRDLTGGVAFLGVGYPIVRERTLAGGTDEEILDWCLQQGSHPNEEQIFVFSSFSGNAAGAMMTASSSR